MQKFVKRGSKNDFLHISRDSLGEDFFLKINFLSAILEIACYRYKHNGWKRYLVFLQEEMRGGRRIGPLFVRHWVY